MKDLFSHLTVVTEKISNLEPYFGSRVDKKCIRMVKTGSSQNIQTFKWESVTYSLNYFQRGSVALVE